MKVLPSKIRKTGFSLSHQLILVANYHNHYNVLAELQLSGAKAVQIWVGHRNPSF